MSSKKARLEEIRRLSARFPRLIEWSEEDRAFMGSAPPLVGQCCHGQTEVDVAARLAIIVDDLVQDVLDGKMPAPRASRERPTAASSCSAFPRPCTRRSRSRHRLAEKASTSTWSRC